MAAAGEVHYLSEPVQRSYDMLVHKDSDMQQYIANIKAQLQDMAATFVDIDEKDKVPACRDQFKELLLLESEVNMHMQALQSCKQSYKASAATTNFKTQLEQKKHQLLGSHQFDPEASQDLKAFDRETLGETAANDDDEDIKITNANDLMNPNCPLTMKSVFELTEPVADSKGYIYEKAAIIAHIQDARRRGHAQVKCPYASTNHYIKESDLRPATQLERVKRRRMLNPGQPTQAQHVYDADEL